MSIEEPVAPPIAPPSAPLAPPTSGVSNTATFGGVVIVGGMVSLLLSSQMDVSVESSYGRVANLDLMSQRQNLVIVSAFAVLVGVLVALFGNRKS